MTKFYDIISPVDMAIITFPYLLSLIFLLAFICLFVEIITDVSRKKSPGRRHIVLTVISAVICCGLAYAIKEYPPDHGHGNDNVCPQAMVNLVGYDYNECKSLYASYFDMEIDKEIYSSEYPAGTIIEQSPKEGSFIEVGHTTVRCVVSKGKQMIIMPNVCGVSYENACNMLEEAGLNYIAGCYQFSETVPRGWAISTEPKAGEEAEADSTVYIYVSMGKEETSAETEEVYSDEYPEGTAISQNPEEGSHIEEGNTNAD